MVVDGSVQRADDSLEVRFTVTDYQANVDVVFEGILPDLFAEGEGVVASGRLGPTVSCGPTRCWPSTTRTTCLRKSPRPCSRKADAGATL
jgi:hypothetical protein